MQFDEQNKDKDNENLQDGLSSISWEDLLNAPEDVDLKSLSNDNKAAEKEEKKNKDKFSDSIPDKDSLKEEGISVLENNELNSENNENKEFDVSSAANSYVNNIEAEDIGIVQNNDNNKEIDLKEPIGLDDDLLIESDGDFELASKDLSDVVDDELIGILNNDDDVPENKPIYSANEPYDINASYNQATPYETEAVAYEENQADGQNETSDEVVSANNYEPDENIEEDFIPQRKAKKKSPVLLFAIILLLGLAAALYGVFTFVLPKTGGIEDTALNPNSSYNTMTDEDVEKQTEELINKVDSKNKKAENKEEKEQKVVVQVTTGGRANPFVPSSMFDDNGFAVPGAQLSTPPDIEDTPEAIAARQLLTISVSGIMYDPSKPSAILRFNNRDYFVQRGDRIDNYVVKLITRDYVAIGNAANVYKAYVGEAFAIDEKIPETNQMKMMNGNRQYISSSDIEISTR